MKYTIIIVDDDRELAYELKEYILLSLEDILFEYSISLKIDIFDSIDDLFFLIDKEINIKDIDIIFLDYNLNDLKDGFDVAKDLYNKGYKNDFIFLTGEGNLFLKGKLKLSPFKYTYIEKGAFALDKAIETIEKDIIFKKGINL